jgi:dipeptidyl aminopeptidase/acylaminoacyl peptidase
MRSFVGVFLFVLISALPASSQTSADQTDSEYHSTIRFSRPALSPVGDKLAFVESGDVPSVIVFDVSEPGEKSVEARIKLKGEDGTDLVEQRYGYLRWMSETKLFIQMLTPMTFNSDTSLYFLGQFYVFDLETRTIIKPFSSDFPIKFRIGAADQTKVVHWPDDDSSKFLVAFHSPRGKYWHRPHVYSVDPVSFETRRVVDSKKDVVQWMADQQGHLRLGFTRSQKGKTGIIHRRNDRDKWRKVDAAEGRPGRTFDVLGFSSDPKRLYVASNHEIEPAGLYEFDLTSEQFGPLIASHERYDVSSVTLSNSHELISAAAGDVLVLASDVIESDLDAISVERDFEIYTRVGSSDDESRTLYLVAGTDDPGAYYLIDRADQSVNLIVDSRSQSAQSASFGKTWMRRFKTRDSLELDAFIALPAGMELEQAQSMPFILMPHGGPWSRDFADFDALTQFLNSKGYGVLKVNFRGSSGYGAEFEELGVGEWGRAMQLDILDALNWGIGESWIDPDRVCVVGWSYGGYASLMASITQADHFQCAASIAGVTDLEALVRKTKDQELLRRIGVKNRKDRDALSEVSPAARVQEIAIPVFVAHGTGDAVVEFEDHYVDFVTALQQHGVDVDPVGFLHGDHSLTADTDRAILYDRLGSFLEKHLAP